MYIPYIEVPTIERDNSLYQALYSFTSFEDENPAFEAFSIFKRKDGIGNQKALFDPSKLKMENISSGSIKLLLKTLDNYRTAVMNWRHNLSVQFNGCASKLFRLNEKRMKVYGTELKKLKNQERELNREVLNRMNSPEQKSAMEEELVKVKERIDFYESQISKLRQAIMIPQDVMNALNEVMSQCNVCFNILSEMFGTYQNWLDIKQKETHFQHGMLKDDDYRKIMTRLISDLHSGSTTYATLMKARAKATDINTGTILGNHYNTTTLVEYKIENVSMILNQYEWFNKIMDKILKRVGAMRSAILGYQAGKENEFTVGELASELVFLINYCSQLSGVMDNFMTPHFGIINCVETMSAPASHS